MNNLTVLLLPPLDHSFSDSQDVTISCDTGKHEVGNSGEDLLFSTGRLAHLICSPSLNSLQQHADSVISARFLMLQP